MAFAQDGKYTSSYDTLKATKTSVLFRISPNDALYNTVVIKNRSGISDTIRVYAIEGSDTINVAIRNFYTGVDDTLLIVPASGTFEYFLLNPNITNVLIKMHGVVTENFLVLARLRKVKLWETL